MTSLYGYTICTGIESIQKVLVYTFICLVLKYRVLFCLESDMYCLIHSFIPFIRSFIPLSIHPFSYLSKRTFDVYLLEMTKCLGRKKAPKKSLPQLKIICCKV